MSDPHVSRDKLHRQIVRLFLHEKQDFVCGDDLKAALSTLERYHDSLPEKVKDVGLINCAATPPAHQGLRKPGGEMVERMKRVPEAPTVPLAEADSGGWSLPSMVKRKIARTKGTWLTMQSVKKHVSWWWKLWL